MREWGRSKQWPTLTFYHMSIFLLEDIVEIRHQETDVNNSNNPFLEKVTQATSTMAVNQTSLDKKRGVLYSKGKLNIF